MNLGFSLGLGGRASGSSGFNPASLTLSGWWRASYTGSPWTPTTSAGSSGTNGNLSEATNPPTAGSAVNGFAPADFDGTNDHLDAAGNAGTRFNDQSFSGWILFNADAVNTNNALPYENDAVISTQSSAYFTVYLKSTGEIGIRFVTLGEAVVSSTFTIGGWTLVQWTYDGAAIRIRVNNGAWQSTPQTGGFGDPANTLHFGTNYAGSAFLDGQILEIGLANNIISNDDFDRIRSYANVRYNVSV